MMDDTSSVQYLLDRIDELDRFAISLGYPPVVDSKGKRKGICQRMSNATDMIEETLGLGNKYRMLSAVAHGHWWAIMGIPVHRDGGLESVPLHGLERDPLRRGARRLRGSIAAKDRAPVLT
jgi:hypothetical protein